MTSSEETKKYNRQKIILGVASTILGIVFLTAVLVSGASAAVEDIVSAWTRAAIPAFILYTLILGGAGFLIELPLSFIGGYVLEHRYGLSQQSFGRWWLEMVKGLGVTLVIGLPLLIIFYLLLRRFPVLWWIPVGGVYFIFSVLLAQLAPVLLFPLFYRFTPLEDTGLVDQLQSISASEGLRVKGVYRFNLSKNTKKANAAFTGLGSTRRILLSDTLLDGFPPEEVVAVLAHELGHYRFGHLWKGLIAGFILSMGGLFLAGLGYRLTMGAFGGVRGDELAVLPLLALFLAAFGLVTAPLQNALSRHFERQADGYAVKKIGDVKNFIAALRRIGELNKADDWPHPLVEWYFYSHPALGRRIRRVLQLAGADA